MIAIVVLGDDEGRCNPTPTLFGPVIARYRVEKETLKNTRLTESERKKRKRA